jgi:hypothetical protein
MHMLENEWGQCFKGPSTDLHSFVNRFLSHVGRPHSDVASLVAAGLSTPVLPFDDGLVLQIVRFAQHSLKIGQIFIATITARRLVLEVG